MSKISNMTMPLSGQLLFRGFLGMSCAEREDLARGIEEGSRDIPPLDTVIRDSRRGNEPHSFLAAAISRLPHNPSTHKSATIPSVVDDVDRSCEHVATALFDRGFRPLKEEHKGFLYFTLNVGADKIFRRLWGIADESVKADFRERQARELEASSRYSPSMYAYCIRRGFLGCCRALIDLEVVDKDARFGSEKITAAFLAHHPKVLKFLIEAGVDPAARDIHGRQAPAYWPSQITRLSDFRALLKTWQSLCGDKPGVDSPIQQALNGLGSAVALGRDEFVLDLVDRSGYSLTDRPGGKSIIQYGIDDFFKGHPRNSLLGYRELKEENQKKLTPISVMSQVLPEGISEGLRFILSPLAIDESGRAWKKHVFDMSPESKLPIQKQLDLVFSQIDRWGVENFDERCRIIYRWLECVNIAFNKNELADAIGLERDGECLVMNEYISSSKVVHYLITCLAQGSINTFVNLENPSFWMGRLISRLPEEVSNKTCDLNAYGLPLSKHASVLSGSVWAGTEMIKELMDRGWEPSALSLSDASRRLDNIVEKWPSMATTVSLWRLQASTPTTTKVRRGHRL